MGTSGILADTVDGPVGVVHQFFKGGFIAVVEKVAWLLPPEYIARGISPGKTRIVLVSRKKVQEKAAVIKIPAMFLPQVEKST